jgi:hypothetical protein
MPGFVSPLDREFDGDSEGQVSPLPTETLLDAPTRGSFSGKMSSKWRRKAVVETGRSFSESRISKLSVRTKTSALSECEDAEKSSCIGIPVFEDFHLNARIEEDGDGGGRFCGEGAVSLGSFISAPLDGKV